MVPELGDSPDTELWAVMYDFGSVVSSIEENNQIDFGDFSFFAAAFGKLAGPSHPPYTAWADFDRSGRIDFGDLAFFAPNFGKTRTAVQSGDQALVFPPNFPGAWRAGAGGGNGEAGEGEARSGEGQWQVLAGEGALQPVAIAVEDQTVLTGVPIAMSERGGNERKQVSHGFVDVLPDAGVEGLVRPFDLPVAARAGAVTDSAFAQIGAEDTERWTTSSGRAMDRPSGRIERNQQLQFGSRWESWEETLSLLAARTPGQLPDEAPNPHDTLFARIGC
jgi:hypothetical protein